MKALEQWRYSRYKKSGRNVPFSAKMRVPFARPLTPALEVSLLPAWHPSSPEILAAVDKGLSLDDATATAMEADLPDAEALGNTRASLLAYYAYGVKNPDKARAERAKLLTWLVEHYPQDDVLGSSYALVNNSGDVLADPDTCAKLTKLWLDAVAQYPGDEKVVLHAVNFFQVVDPQNAIGLLAKYPSPTGLSNWAGDLYGLASVGVSALNPSNSTALAAAHASEASGFGGTARSVLLASNDTKMVLVALSVVRRAGIWLARTGQLPESFQDFCQGLLAHAKELYPQTMQTCDVDLEHHRISPEATGAAPQRQEITQTKLIKKVQALYPQEAKGNREGGTITLSALVTPSGDVEQIRLKSGAFVFYPAVMEAVSKWKYSPLLIDNEPVATETEIVINFTMSY